MPERIDVNDRPYFDIDETGLTEEPVHPTTDKYVDPVRARVFFEDLEKTVPSSKRRIADVRKVVGLMAGNHAARPSEPNHLANY